MVAPSQEQPASPCSLLFLTGCGSEVLDCLAVVLGSTQQHTVLACGALQGQLVKGEALTTSLRADTGSSRCNVSSKPRASLCVRSRNTNTNMVGDFEEVVGYA